MPYVIGPDERLLYNLDADTTVAPAEGVSGWANFGLASSGRFTVDGGVIEHRAVGDWRPWIFSPGLSKASGTADLVVQNSALLTTAGAIVLRAAATGRLTKLALGARNRTEGEIHNNAIIDSIRLEAAAGGELRASLDWKAQYMTPVTSGHTMADPGLQTDKVLMWYHSTFDTVAAPDEDFGNSRGTGAKVEITAFSIQINNNTDYLPVMGASGVEGVPDRGARYIREGAQSIVCNLRLLVPTDDNMAANALVEIPEVHFIFYDGTDTLNIHLFNLAAAATERGMNADGLAEHGQTYLVRDMSITNGVE